MMGLQSLLSFVVGLSPKYWFDLYVAFALLCTHSMLTHAAGHPRLHISRKRVLGAKCMYSGVSQASISYLVFVSGLRHSCIGPPEAEGCSDCGASWPHTVERTLPQLSILSSL
eukprot:4467117-Amphidinium_carterae.3